jgi:hypothetical protein
MSDDPTQAMGPIGEPTVPVEAGDAAGGGSGPPTEAMPALPSDDEPPRNKGLRIALIVVLLLIAAVGLVLLTVDDDEDRPLDGTTTTSVDDTTTTTVDGSTTTTEPTTTPSSTTTTSTTVAAAPSIDSLTASPIACPDPLTLTWTSTNAVSVEVAIDNPGGVFDTGPPSGSMQVPAPCGTDTQTYYVTAIGSGGERSTETLVLP